MKLAVLSIAALLLAHVALAEDAKPVQAIATIEATKGNTIKGTVKFMQTGDKTKIVAEITGLKPESKHGFHIHEGGECGEDGMAAKGHYNPDNQPHGGPDSPKHHAGDLGNITADKDGNAHYELTVDYISINGKNPVVGRAVVVHQNPDDLVSQPVGNAGPRIGCGVIKVVEEAAK